MSDIPSNIDKFIEQQLTEGIYSSYEEMVAEGLRLLQEKQTQDQQIADSIGPAVQYFRNGNPGLKPDADEVKRLGRKFLASEQDT